MKHVPGHSNHRGSPVQRDGVLPELARAVPIPLNWAPLSAFGILLLNTSMKINRTQLLELNIIPLWQHHTIKNPPLWHCHSSRTQNKICSAA